MQRITCQIYTIIKKLRETHVIRLIWEWSAVKDLLQKMLAISDWKKRIFTDILIKDILGKMISFELAHEVIRIFLNRCITNLKRVSPVNGRNYSWSQQVLHPRSKSGVVNQKGNLQFCRLGSFSENFQGNVNQDKMPQNLSILLEEKKKIRLNM